jgi:AcrR family transcriptional regulator
MSRRTAPSTPPNPSETERGDRYHHGDLRAALLQAAAEALAEHGVGGLSLRDCARRVGVSHAAPYRHFASKEALLGALALQGFAWLTAAGRAAMAEESTALGRLHAYGRAYVRFAIDEPERFRLMFASPFSFECDDETPDAAAADEAYALLRDAAAAVSAAGVDADVAAVRYWSRPHGLAMLVLDGRIPAERVADEASFAALVEATLRDPV